MFNVSEENINLIVIRIEKNDYLSYIEGIGLSKKEEKLFF